MKMIHKAAECDITVSKDTIVTIGDCCPEAVSYAVRRLFAGSRKLCRECVPVSYAKRFASGRARRPERGVCIVPACLAELEGELLRIEYDVDSSGVTIRNIRPLSFD